MYKILSNDMGDLCYSFDTEHTIAAHVFGRSVSDTMKRIAQSRVLQFLVALNLTVLSVQNALAQWHSVQFAVYVIPTQILISYPFLFSWILTENIPISLRRNTRT